MIKYLSRNFTLVLGLGILSISLIIWLIFYIIVDLSDAQALSFRPSQAPSMDHWLGTDRMGKDVLTSIVIGTPQTIQIGIIAGGIGILLGVVLGFTAGFFGGIVDYIIKFVVDVFQSIPPLVVLIIFAISICNSSRSAGVSVKFSITAYESRI